MTIDIINLAGEQTYFKDSSGNLNLAEAIPSVASTLPLGKGKQLNVSGIQFYIEGDDLTPLFNILEEDQSGKLVKRAQPLIGLSLTKEVLPGLFADSFKSRTHTLAGKRDFERGTFQNAGAYLIEGKPTIVSIGSEKCSWKSIRYELPEDIKIDSAYWDIPSSRDTPSGAFSYSIILRCYQADGSALPAIVLADNNNPQHPRVKQDINLQNVRFYEFEFIADVKHDSKVKEKIVTEKGETVGRPLLEAIYLIEPVNTKYEFYSIQEFLEECSEYNLFDGLGKPMNKLTATLSLPYVFVQSQNENIGSGIYEHIELKIKTDKFKTLTAKLISSVLLKSM